MRLFRQKSSVESPTLSQTPLGPTLPGFQANYITDADRQRATQLMTEQRVREGKDKKNQKSEPFTYKEANPVLNALVGDKSTTVTAGLVQALLDHGGNASIDRPQSTNLLKKVFHKDQKERRSDLLARATQNCNTEVVWVLTQRADETAKNESLPFAIRQNDSTKAKILLLWGADADPLCKEFLMSVENGWDDMVEVVLTAKKGPCQICRNQGLIKAVEKGSIKNSQILLDQGADADYQGGAALQMAIANSREDLATIITACAKRPSPASLDVAVGVAYDKLAMDTEKRHRVMENCLQTGAKGATTDETLVKACKNGQLQLIEILLEHGASVDYGSGDALQFAITSKQPKLLRTLLRGKPSNITMATVIPHIMTLNHLALAHEITDILLSAGLRGDSVAETLIKAIEMGIPGGTEADHLEFLRLLLENGQADVNLSEGRSIVLATTQKRIDVLALLLRHDPTVDSLNAAFSNVPTDPELSLEISTMILEAGARGKVVDEALVVSASTGKDGANLTSAILKQSSVDYDGGKPLVNAIKSRCLEQVQALMVGQPSVSTITVAWEEADAIEDDESQFKILEALLTGTVDAPLKDKSLVAAAARGQRGIPVCSLLLKNQASPERMEGGAVVAAAKGLHLDILHILAEFTTSENAFITAFDSFTDGEQWLQSRGLEVVHFLLDHGASGPEVDAAFCKAARLYEPDALELLATSINPEVVNVALVLATQASDDWLSPNNRNLWLVHSLLEWGAEGEGVHAAFLKAVDAYCKGLTSAELIETFLSVGAKVDVNFQEGEALQIAIRNGKAPLLKRLTSAGASKNTMSLAFQETITANLEEDVALSLIDVLVKNKDVTPDFKTPPEGYQPPLFSCLAAHPQSAKLVKRLLKIGCDVEAKIDEFLYDDEEVDAEPATVLAWALCQPDKRIGSAAIGALIDGKANIHFTAPTSRTTPLILAAKNGRGDIVGKLVGSKANTSSRDRFDRSALFYASRIGDLESVSTLIKAKSPTNDGSLQEAAKNLHYDVVAALIKGKHNPNFPSSKEQHQGRTALQEMALMCDASNEPTKMEATIRALSKGNVLEQSRGKNALFLALDNLHPVPVTKALLNCLMWEHINKKENVYVEEDPESRTKYFFSPTAYVYKGLSQGPESDNARLLEILRDKRCEDRYYAEEGAEQPEDAVGMPQEIIDAERKRKDHEGKLRKKELEHQLKQLHTKNEAELKQEIERSKHEEKLFREEELSRQKMEQKEMAHQQQLIQEAQKAAQKQDIMANTNALKISLQQQADTSKQRALAARAEFEERQKMRMAQIKAAALEEEQNLKLSFQQKAANQKLALQERQNRLAMAASKQKVLTARQLAETHAAEARHKLAIKQKQDAQALRLMRGTASHKHDMHQMKMQEMQAQGENMRVKMLDKYFQGQQKNLKRITA